MVSLGNGITCCIESPWRHIASSLPSHHCLPGLSIENSYYVMGVSYAQSNRPSYDKHSPRIVWGHSNRHLGWLRLDLQKWLNLRIDLAILTLVLALRRMLNLICPRCGNSPTYQNLLLQFPGLRREIKMQFTGKFLTIMTEQQQGLAILISWSAHNYLN